jgi:hypothetical protein
MLSQPFFCRRALSQTVSWQLTKVSFRVDGYMTVTRRLHPELVEFVTSHG